MATLALPGTETTAVRTVDKPERRGGKGSRAGKAGPVTYTLLTLTALVSIFPLYWTVVAGSHTNA
jgi:cellobiose transport system permease protein